MTNIQSLLQPSACAISRLECEILLSEVLQKNRAYLMAHPELQLNAEQLSQYQALQQQRIEGVPIAYLTGKRDFWSLTLQVNRHTLIPRHETELLVEIALTHLPNTPDVRVLDLGTGSGAIALALAKERPYWHIDACDISTEALAIARQNAAANQITNVHFYHSDWFAKLPDVRYQAIVANPPYVAEHDPHLLQGDLRFEPLSALASSQNGLADLQYIIKHAKDFLLPNAMLLLEHGYDQKNRLATILKEIGYTHIQCWQDIQGQDRVSGGLYKGD
jgi:release factor glutamine methyltransferase